MTAVLVDSNVLLDLMTEDPRWFAWSASAMEGAANSFRLVINPIIYAEVSVRYSRIEDLDAALPKAMIEREAIPYEAAFLAEGVPGLPAARRNETVASSGFFHRRPCRGCRLSPVDTRCDALSQLLSEATAGLP